MNKPPPSRIFMSPPHMSGRELEYVHEAFASNYVAPAGSMLVAFEEAVSRYTGIPYAVALSSGTAAIHLALKSLPLEQGDEIWASTLTFIGGVSAIVHDRMKPVFIDSDEATWTMDPQLLANELRAASRRGALPKLVIPTDVFGQSCDLDAISAACAEYEVPVVTDSAEALGTIYKNRHAGNGALAAVLSFNGNKIITTSGGGMLCSHDKAIIDRARFLSTQAREPFSHYEHVEVGFNYRLSNVSAAIGLGQMEVLDERVARRRAVFALYRQYLGGLPGVSFMPEASYGRATRWLSVVCIDKKRAPVDRIAVQAALEAENIESRPIWKPMHCQPVFRDARVAGGAVAEHIFDEGLCLPSGTAMTDNDVERVSDVIRRTFSGR